VAIISESKTLNFDTIVALKARTNEESLVQVFFHLINQYENRQN